MSLEKRNVNKKYRYFLIKTENDTCFLLQKIGDKNEAIRWKRRHGKRTMLSVWDSLESRFVVI